MRAGSLKHRITIKELSSGQDDLGQPVQTETIVASMWADIRLLSGLETIKAGAETAIVNASIRVRYRTDIAANMRVYEGADVYEIKAVLPDKVKKAYVDLACKQING